MLRSPRPTDETRRQLDEYFEGKRHEFELPLDLGLTREFGRAVLDQLALVPYGELTTYGALAAKAGRPRAARAVGTVMNRNPVPIVLPCHRVVGSTGSLVGYAGGLDRKRTLLELEGASPFDRCAWISRVNPATCSVSSLSCLVSVVFEATAGRRACRSPS